jgi:hypothetical protein
MLINNINKLIDETNWSERTKKNRKSFIIKLNNDLNPDKDNIEFIKDSKLISNYIFNKFKNPSTIKNTFLTIKSIINLLDPIYNKEYEPLIDKAISDANIYIGNNIQNINKLLTYDEMKSIPDVIETHIKCIYDKLILEIDYLNTFTNNNLFIYLRFLTDWIISILYTQQEPVRCDWSIVKLKESDIYNWYDKNKNIIYWNDFKNIKSFGKINFELNDKIKNSLEVYLKILDYYKSKLSHFNEIDNSLLLYIFNKNGPIIFTRETFSIYFSRMIFKYLNKKLSINDFRHSYENHIIKNLNYNNMTINEKKNIHNRLLHTISTAHSYLTV